MKKNPSLALASAKLALADILHEKRMSLCMILAVMAIATPLLLFFGLKNGTVTTLRQRLLNDPVKMEILPRTSHNYDDAWFETWRKNPLVSFVIPKTRSLAAPVDMENPRSKARIVSVDAKPTGPDDTLLVRYGVPVPGMGEMTVSPRVAREIGLSVGDLVTIAISRTRKGREKVSLDLKVAGIMPKEACGDNEKTAYMPIGQVVAIEEYKSGRAVASHGWPGEEPLAPLRFDTVLVLTQSQLDAEKQASLATGTGFVSCEQQDPASFAELKLPGGWNVYRLSTVGGQASPDNIAAVEDLLRGSRSILVPLAESLRLEVAGSGFVIAPAAGLKADLPGQQTAGLNETWKKIDQQNIARAFLVSANVWNRLVKLPESQVDRDAVRLEVKVLAEGKGQKNAGQNSVSFVATFYRSENLAEGQALAPCSLIGVLNGMKRQPVVDGKTANGEAAFLQGRRYYANFRMYARGLEQVAPLAEELRQNGIEVETSSREIGGVLTLDKTLNDLFLVIASASLFGGLACLGASIVASVDRKRRDLAVLGLLGVGGLSLQVFPVVSVLTVTFGGLILALAVFNSLGWWINNSFSQLGTGEQYCALSMEQQLAAVAIGLALALVAGLFAAHRLTGIEPSEALRDE